MWGGMWNWMKKPGQNNQPPDSEGTPEPYTSSTEVDVKTAPTIAGMRSLEFSGIREEGQPVDSLQAGGARSHAPIDQHLEAAHRYAKAEQNNQALLGEVRSLQAAVNNTDDILKRTAFEADCLNNDKENIGQRCDRLLHDIVRLREKIKRTGELAKEAQKDLNNCASAHTDLEKQLHDRMQAISDANTERAKLQEGRRT